MNIKNVTTATEARNNWFEIINRVYFTGKPVFIKKNNKIILKLSPVNKIATKVKKKSWRDLEGFLKDEDTYFPYEDPKIIELEKKRNNLDIWK